MNGFGRRAKLEGDDNSYGDLINKPVQVILPVWLNTIQEEIPLENLGRSLDFAKILNAPLPAVLPTWSSTILQSSVSVSNFGSQVNWNAHISNRPTFNWTTLAGIQFEVTLSNFGGSLTYSRIVDPPTQ